MKTHATPRLAPIALLVLMLLAALAAPAVAQEGAPPASPPAAPALQAMDAPCTPLSEDEQATFDKLAQMKEAGQLDNADYDLFLKLSERAHCVAQPAAPVMTTGANGDCTPLSSDEQALYAKLAQRNKAGQLQGADYELFLKLSERANCVAQPAAPDAINAVGGYTFASSSGTYTAITGGTQHGSGSGLDDDNYNAVNIGFSFTFNGTAYTQLNINANGFVRFGGTAFSLSCGFAPISSTDTTNCINLAAAMTRDLAANSTSSEIRSQLTGSSPSQVFVVQWKDFKRYLDSGESYNFQIRLYETSNKVEYVYGSFTEGSTTDGAPQVGIKGDSTTDFNNRTGTNWAASTAGSSSTATMTLSSTSTPSTGQTYTWTPPNFPPSITYTTLANTTSTANRSFTGVAITDSNGVNTTAGTKPRLYYKRSTDTNAWNSNTSSTAGWKYVEANGASSPFDFTINYSLLNGGTGVSAGTTVQYFVVAQDLASTPLVAINSGAFAATPSSVALTSAAFPIGGTINSYSVLQAYSGSYNVGAGQTYTSLTNTGGIFCSHQRWRLDGQRHHQYHRQPNG